MYIYTSFYNCTYKCVYVCLMILLCGKLVHVFFVTMNIFDKVSVIEFHLKVECRQTFKHYLLMLCICICTCVSPPLHLYYIKEDCVLHLKISLSHRSSSVLIQIKEIIKPVKIIKQTPPNQNLRYVFVPLT